MPAIRASSADHARLLEAFRAQVAAQGTEEGKWLALLAWNGQPGVRQDELIDIVRAATEGRPETPPRPRRGSVQRSPFA
jgi:hypothetical protein